MQADHRGMAESGMQLTGWLDYRPEAPTVTNANTGYGHSNEYHERPEDEEANKGEGDMAASETTKSDRSRVRPTQQKVIVSPKGGYFAKQCDRRAAIEADPRYANAPKASPSPALAERMEKGTAFEEEIRQIWRKKLGSKLAVVPACDRSSESKTSREALTMELLEHPGRAVAIWNPRLRADLEGSRIAEPDFLVRIGTGKNGTPIWAPGDVKWHRTLEGTAKPSGWTVSPLTRPFPDAGTRTELGRGVPHKSDAMQLAHYRRVLEHHGYAQMPKEDEPYWSGLIGKEGVLLWFNLDAPLYNHSVDADDVEPGGSTRVRESAQECYDREFAWRVMVVAREMERITDPELETLAYPEWKDECKECPWKIVCHDELRFQHRHHITLLPGITPQRAQAHYRRGVRSAHELAGLDYQTAVLVDAGVNPLTARERTAELGSSVLLQTALELRPDVATRLAAAGFSVVADLEKVHEPTAAYAESRVHNLPLAIDQARVAIVGHPHLARDVEYVEIPRAVIERDIDIEDADGHCYLIGALDTGKRVIAGRTKSRREYRPFVDWSSGGKKEHKVFADWWRDTQHMLAYSRAQHYSFCMYHYTDHEGRYFRALAERHAGKPGVPTLADLEEFLESSTWVDMHPIVAGQIIWPAEDVTLKSIARYLQFNWRDDQPGGGNSIAWYRQATTSTAPYERRVARKRLLEYNEDDVRATFAIRNWTAKVGDARKPGNRIPNVKDLDARFQWSHY